MPTDCLPEAPSPYSRPLCLRPRCVRAAAAALCAGMALGALGLLGSVAHAGYVPQDDEIEALLKRADDLFEHGRVRQGVNAYLLIEDRLEDLRAEQPEVRPLIESGAGVYRSLPEEIAARIRSRGAAALDAYRAARSPHIQGLMQAAEARPFDPAPITAILARFPLAKAAPALLRRLGDLQLEAGDASAAARAYREALRSLDPERREGADAAAIRRALERVDTLAAAARAATGPPRWTTWFGSPQRRAALASIPFPGAQLYTSEIPASELGIAAQLGFARRRAPLPRIYHPITDGKRVYLSDGKGVRALDARTGRLAWLYMARDPKDMRNAPHLSPDRLPNMAASPTLAGGLVYAALNRNTPPIYDPEGEPSEDGRPDPHSRARDWRLIALDAASGRLRWDASERADLAELSRFARYVSTPLVTGGRAIYSVLRNEQGEQGDLVFEVWVLDAATGALRDRIRVCSGIRFDFLGLAAWCAPPTLDGGTVFVATHLGLVAALDLDRSETLWASAYPELPRESQKRVIERGRRFGPLPLIAARETLISCPQDSVFMLGLDKATGRERWRLRRGPHDRILGVAAGLAVLGGQVGTALQITAVHAATGRVAWQRRIENEASPGSLGFARPTAEDFGAVRGGLVTATRTLVVTGRTILALATASGAIERVIDLPRGVSGGALVALPGGDLLLASATRVSRLEAAPRSLARLEAQRRSQPGLASALALGVYLAQQGRATHALALLVPALEAAEHGPAAAPQLEALRIAISVAATRAGQSATSEDARFAFEVQAALHSPPRPSTLAALRDLSDRLLAAGRGEQAVRLYAEAAQRLRSVRFSVAPGIRTRADLWARQRLDRLRAKRMANPRGEPSIFAAYDTGAERALARALRKAQLSPEELETIARRFPTSPAEAKALARLAQLFESRGVSAVAARVLSDRVRRFPADPETPRLLWRRARLLKQARRFHEEEEALALLARAYPAATSADGGRLQALAESRLAEIRRSTRLPWLATGFAPEDLKPIFHTTIDLTDGDAELLAPQGFESESTFLVGSSRFVEARLTGTGIKRWRFAPGPSHPGLTALFQLQHLASGGGVVAIGIEESQGSPPSGASPGDAKVPAFLPPNLAREAVLSLDLGTGRPLFRSSALDLLRIGVGQRPDQLGPLRTPKDWLDAAAAVEETFGVELANDPDAVTGIAIAGNRLVVVVGPAVVCLDARSGALRWRVVPEGSLRGTPLVATAPDGASLVALFQENPEAVLVGLDLATGAERYRTRLGPRGSRLTLRAQVAAQNPDRAFCCVGGNRLLRLDLDTGRVKALEELAFWPRSLVAEPLGQAVCVIAHREGTQPAVVAFDAGTGEVLAELHPTDDPRRISRAVFAGADLYVTASGAVAPGAPKTSILRAIDWRSGELRWTWSPQPNHILDRVVPTESHLVLPRSGMNRPGVVYVIERVRGRIYRRFELPRRRSINARVVAGEVLVATTRGVTGFGLVDPGRNEEVLAEIAAAIETDPADSSLVALFANRQFRAGREGEAAYALERALASESLRLRPYDLLQDQLVALQQHETGRGPLVEIPKLAHPPVIDGELQDSWPVEQSFALSSQRFVTPIQGQPGVSVLRGDDDLSATLYVGYDDHYFYFALDVTDSSLVPYDTESDDWRGDCLLIATDATGNGGDYYASDDNLMSLALALPKRKKDGEEDEEEEEDDDPNGQYFVKRKEDGSGAVYECAIPWSALKERGARVDPSRGPEPGFTFGFNFVLTDDDDGEGSRKTLQWSPAIWLHKTKRNIWEGFVPDRFVRIRCR